MNRWFMDMNHRLGWQFRMLYLSNILYMLAGTRVQKVVCCWVLKVCYILLLMASLLRCRNGCKGVIALRLFNMFNQERNAGVLKISINR